MIWGKGEKQQVMFLKNLTYGTILEVEMHRLIILPTSLRFFAVLRDNKWVEPLEFWENADTKRRLQNLLIVSGLIDSLAKVKARPATKSEITLFHTEEYYSNIVEQTKKGIRKFFLKQFA